MHQSKDNDGTGASKLRPGRVDVGKRVSFFSESDKKTKYGVLRYYGEPEFAPGWWCGVELDQPEGKNNGSLQGIRYFSCDEGFGVFVPLSKVELDSGSKHKPKPSGTDLRKINAGRLLNDVAGHRKASAPKATAGSGSSSGGRKPLKAFSLQDKQHGFPAAPLASKVRTIVPRASSSDNIKAMSKSAIAGTQPGVAKKSSSARDLRAGARTPDSVRAYTPVGITVLNAPPSPRSVRSSSFSGFSRELPSSRAPSRSSVVSGSAYTDAYLSPFDGQSRAISPASSRDVSVSHFTIGESAQSSPPLSSYNIAVQSPVPSSSGGEEAVGAETSHAGGSYLYFSWDGSAANDKVKPHDTHDALINRLMDPTQSTDGLTVHEVVGALRHHMAVCQHNTDQLLRQLSRANGQLQEARKQLSAVQTAHHIEAKELATSLHSLGRFELTAANALSHTQQERSPRT